MSSGPILKARALGYLARREYSRWELEKKLAAHAQPSASEALPEVLDRLEQHGFLSAERVVEQVIRMRRYKFGSQRIEYELKQKGIDAHLIANALLELRETELDAVYEVWGKKFGALPVNVKERGKQIRFLAGRGFSSEVIHQVLSRPGKKET